MSERMTDEAFRAAQADYTDDDQCALAADHRRARAEETRLMAENAEQRAELLKTREVLGITELAKRDLVAENAELRRALEAVLKSAHPHPTEHPSMTRAWAAAREVLDAKP